nr:hypothetical protein [Halomonas elongata]
MPRTDHRRFAAVLALMALAPLGAAWPCQLPDITLENLEEKVSSFPP